MSPFSRKKMYGGELGDCYACLVFLEDKNILSPYPGEVPT
jgi:hypothetical protein